MRRWSAGTLRKNKGRESNLDEEEGTGGGEGGQDCEVAGYIYLWTLD